MRFYLTGGWGYQNLGDYAILIATVRWLIKYFPDVSLTVSSFDVNGTRNVLREFSVNVVESVHRRYWGIHPLRELEVDGYHTVMPMPDSGFFIRAVSHIQSRLRGSLSRKLNGKGFRRLKEIDEAVLAQLAGHDALIVCGGGYLNRWSSCFLSHAMEWKAATHLDIPIKLLGPTVGPFDDWQIRMMRQFLSNCEEALVRDKESCLELSRIGILAKMIPDLALLDSSNERVREDVRTVLLIPGDLPPQRWKELLSGLTDFAHKKSCSYRIVTTRLYARDILYAKIICKKLSCGGVSAEYQYTLDYDKLLTQFDDVRYVVSWNLHGLILAWRRGIPGICLNVGRKFTSFMEQTAMSDFMLNWRTFTARQLTEGLERLWSAAPSCSQNPMRRQRIIDCLTNELGPVLDKLSS